MAKGITRGEWEAKEDNCGDITIMADSPEDDSEENIAEIDVYKNEAEYKANAKFICLCANQCQAVNPENPMAVAEKIGEMVVVFNKIMALDDTGVLEMCAYSGGDVPKKWLKKEMPILDARAKARKEIKDIVRPLLADIERKE